MGLQFVLGLRSKRSHRNYFGDSGYLGSVGENIGRLSRSRLGAHKKGSVAALAAIDLYFLTPAFAKSDFNVKYPG